MDHLVPRRDGREVIGLAPETNPKGNIMIRNLKILGLGLVAVFALSAVTASAASAQVGTITSTGPVTLTGTQTGAKNENSLTAFGGVVTCANAKYTGHKTLTEAQTISGLKHEAVPNDTSKVTITPHYGSCITTQAGIEFPTTVDMNSCDFHFDLGVTIAANKYKVKAAEECVKKVPENPALETIKITVFANAAKHTANEPFCVIDITKQTERGETLAATDTLNGTIDITGTIEGIKADRESPTGSILCPKEETKTGILHIDATITGDNVGGAATTVSLSHT
jgi:hypothetical protein